VKTTRRWRPEVEAFEDRLVLSAVHPVVPVMATAATHVVHHHHKLHHKHTAPGHHTAAGSVSQPQTTIVSDPVQQSPLSGTVSGTWTMKMTLPDTGGDQVLTGTGNVAPLGDVQMSGELHTPGFILMGETTGTVTLSNADGSVTLQLVGPPQPGFSPPPSTFQYTITGGTGKYTGLSGSGTVTFEEQPEQHPICNPGMPCPQYIIAASFTMTFVAAAV
jgi:hypothetical protein